MNDTPKELSTRYYVAEGSVWMLSAVLIISHYLGVAPDQAIPILNITPNNTQHFAVVVATLLISAVLYMFVEWKQSSRVARDSRWQCIRFSVSVFVAAVSFWLSHATVLKGTRFAEVFPGWYIGFIVIGFFIGTLVSELAFSALMIRSPQESRRLRLPRIPAATWAQFILWLPVTLLLVFAYYVLLHLAPPEIVLLACALVLIPFLAVLIEGAASLFLACDEHGKRIPYAKRIAGLKEIHDWHDYECFLNDPRHVAAFDTNILTEGTLKGVQKAVQKKYEVNRSSAPKTFHVQQLEEVQIQFYPKDGNPQNNDKMNCGVRVQKRGGKENQIRVLFVPDDAQHPKNEMSISSASVEKYAEQYIRGHAGSEEATLRKLLSHAVNSAVLDALVDDAGPLLHRLVQSGQEKAVADAIKNRCDVNEVAEAGWTPLLYASAQGYPRIARMLLDAGANPDIGNVRGVTPLMYSAHYGNNDVCEILLEHHASVNVQDVFGMTALSIASRDGHIEIVNRLLRAKADLTIATRDGKRALDFAYACGHGKIAKMLKKATVS